MSRQIGERSAGRSCWPLLQIRETDGAFLARSKGSAGHPYTDRTLIGIGNGIALARLPLNQSGLEKRVVIDGLVRAIPGKVTPQDGSWLAQAVLGGLSKKRHASYTVRR